MKTVLHLITGLENGGGAESSLFKTLPRLEKTKPVVCVMKGNGEISRKLKEAGVTVRYLDMKSKFDVAAVFRYRQILHEVNPDLQVNYLIHADIFGRIFGKIFRVPRVIAYIRNRHENKYFTFFDKLTLPLADFVLTNSESSLHTYRKKYGVPEEKSACISNGVNFEQDLEYNADAVAEIRKELDLKEDVPTFINVARLHPQKGHEVLLDALRRLKDRELDFRMLFVGDGELRVELEEKARMLGLEKEVNFLGRREDVSALLDASDVFLFSSFHEGMSNALLEAMARRKACVVSAIRENTELIQEGKNGLTFIPRDVEDFSEKLEKLMKNPEMREQLGLSARQTVEEKYSLADVTHKLDKFFYEAAR